MTSDHFLTELAKVPSGSATEAIDPPAIPLNVKAFTPEAKLDRLVPIFSGTTTELHFDTEEAKVPRGSAISEIAPAPKPEKVLRRPPRAVSLKAPIMDVNPRLMSSQDIDPNLINAFANESNCETIASIDIAPKAAETPIRPSVPVAITNSANAPPMETKPVLT